MTQRQLLIRTARRVQEDLEQAINETPTGSVRVALSSANIIIQALVNEVLAAEEVKDGA